MVSLRNRDIAALVPWRTTRDSGANLTAKCDARQRLAKAHTPLSPRFDTTFANAHRMRRAILIYSRCLAK
jgi:hypothetical protein